MTKMKRAQTRKIERDLKVFLEELPMTLKYPRQRFSVFNTDEEETYVNDIVAMDIFFTEDELRVKIMELH